VSTEIAQTARATEVIEHLRDNVDETLDEFEVELSETFPAYRDRVHTAVDQLPEWAESDPSDIRALFELDSDDVADERAWLGPQMVGVAAGRIEAFALEWLGTSGASEPPRLSASTAETFDRESRDVRQWLARLESLAYERLEEGHETLDARLESTLERLESEREERFEGLRERVDEGDIEAGEDEQAERARIWEEQRRRAEAIRSSWRDLRALLDEGYTYAATHLEELATLLEETHDELSETYPELSESAIVETLRERVERREIECRRDASPEERLVDDLPDPDSMEPEEDSPPETEAMTSHETAPPRESAEPTGHGGEHGATQPALEGLDDESSGGFARDPLAGTDDDPGTDPLAGDFSDLDDDPFSAPEPEPESSETMPPESDVGLAGRSEADGTPAAEHQTGDLPAVDDAPSNELSETAHALDESPLASEPSETSPASEVNHDGGDTPPTTDGPESPDDLPETRSNLGAVAPEDSEPDERPALERTAADASPERPSRSPSRRIVESERSGPGAEPTPTPEEALDSSSEAVDGAMEREDERDSPAIASQCLRIRDVWEPIDLSAVALALGPPALVLAALVGTCLLHLIGIPGVVNPIRAWAWTQPVAAVAMIWCLCAPMIMGWRPRWRGWSFDVLHRVERREERDLEIGPERVRLGERRFDWQDVRHVERQRWGDSSEDVFGWQLAIEPEHGRRIDFITRESDVQAWQSSSTPLTDPATDAWQVDPREIEAILERAPGGEPLETDMGSE
jgi:hypothetical protein